MLEKPINSVKLPGFVINSYEVDGAILHIFEVVARIGLAERVPAYDVTIKLTGKRPYFCILDNRGRHENSLTYDDMVSLDKMLMDGGITEFYGATVSNDNCYGKLVALARQNMDVFSISGELFETKIYQDAEHFILDRIIKKTGTSLGTDRDRSLDEAG